LSRFWLGNNATSLFQRRAMTASAPNNTNALANGAVLDGYVITGLIGQGGFGVVYVARDTQSNRTVAIKEYLPSAIAGRVASGLIAPRSSDMANAFATGLKGFLREANLLSELAHPALVAVHRAWEQNGTAYMAMAYYPGKTLRDVRLARPVAMTEAHVKALMLPVFDAVAELHAHRVIHRDISPDNILVMANGATVLLDLGAARQVLGGMTQALTTILKPGFAPIEQYVEDGSMEQGRWTDVYGLGAVIYFLATGKPPTAATTRIVRDTLPSMMDVAKKVEYSQRFAQAVTRSLAVRAIDRYKSMSEFREGLGWSVVMNAPRLETPAEKTAALAALSADDIRRLTAPEIEAPIAPSAPTPHITLPSAPSRAPALEKLRGRPAGYVPDQRLAWLVPALVVIAVIVAAVLYVGRR
jgi:non-specific serine/threonine protein kinase